MCEALLSTCDSPFPDLWSNTCDPARVGPMFLTQDCFGKGFVLTLTQISCRPAEHRANQREQAGVIPSFTPSIRLWCSASQCAGFFVCLLLSSHLFSPLSKNRIYGSLSPVCLHPACVQRHNRSPKRESAPVSALRRQDIPARMNRMTVCLQHSVISLLETIYDFQSIALVCHCNKTMPLCNPIPNSPHRLSLSPAPSFLPSLTFVQGYSFSPWLETVLK